MSLIAALDGAIPVLHPTAWIAPDAVVVGRVTLGRSASVWYGAVLRADCDEIVVGPECNIQDQCCLHVDEGEPALLAERVSLGHRATVHGAQVEAGALIGIGAIVLGGARVGAGALVAAGAIVLPGTRVPAGVLFAGVPGRIVRELTDADRATFADTPSSLRRPGRAAPRGIVAVIRRYLKRQCVAVKSGKLRPMPESSGGTASTPETSSGRSGRMTSEQAGREVTRRWPKNDPDGSCGGIGTGLNLMTSSRATAQPGEVDAVRGYVDLRVHDTVALDEIELYAEVLSAVAASDRPLTDDELDEVLGLMPIAGRLPVRPDPLRDPAAALPEAALPAAG